MQKDRSGLWDNPQVFLYSYCDIKYLDNVLRITGIKENENMDIKIWEDIIISSLCSYHQHHRKRSYSSYSFKIICSVLGGHLLGRGGPREGSGGHGLCGHRDGREVADNADDLFLMLMMILVIIIIMTMLMMAVGMEMVGGG